MQLLARDYRDSRPHRFELANGKIARITPLKAEETPATPLPYVAPGLVDLQLNGYGGVNFVSPELTPEKVVEAARAVDRFGVRWFLPTLCTAAAETFLHALRTIDEACRTLAEAHQRIAGVHLEGPYISAEDGARGAHPRAHCRNPDFDEFRRWQDAAGGRIRLITLAPEQEGSLEFIRRATDLGVVVGLGHTAAEGDRIRAAVDAGARLSTHLGNGAPAMIHRHRANLWNQLADDRLTASLIGDGHHLPPAVFKTFIRAKTPRRCILVSDLVPEAGLPPGRHEGWAGPVDVLETGRLVVAGQREMMAGAAEPLGTGIANAVHHAGVTLPEAVAMALDHPAELLGLKPGRLEPDEPADLVVFDLDEDAFHVRAMIRNAEVVFGIV